MARARFTPRPGATRELASSREMGAFLGAVADAAAGEAQRRLPYPRILGGITISGTTDLTADGYEGLVVIKGPGWHLHEYGTRNHGARPAIRPGVQAAITRAGGRWKAT